MDIKHRKAYARVKLSGIKDEVLLNEGVSLVKLMSQLLVQLNNAPNRYEGVDIRLEFNPINKDESSLDQFKREVWAGLDMSLVEMATEEQELEYAKGNPSDPKSGIYDSIYAEWVHCHNSIYRESKTPGDLALLRKHIEMNYSDSQWWNGVHRW